MYTRCMRSDDKTLVRIVAIVIPDAAAAPVFDPQIALGRRPFLLQAVANLRVQAGGQLLPVDRAHANQHHAEEQRVADRQAKAERAGDAAEVAEAARKLHLPFGRRLRGRAAAGLSGASIM